MCISLGRKSQESRQSSRTRPPPRSDATRPIAGAGEIFIVSVSAFLGLASQATTRHRSAISKYAEAKLALRAVSNES